MTLRIDHLDFSFGRAAVLEDVSCAAAPGRITAVLGPNAAGKTTLLRCAIGALRPQRGSAMVDGCDVRRLRGRGLAQRIAYVAQRSIVSAAFTVRQVVELGRYALPASRARVDHALAALDLATVEHRPFSQLSAGQQQRASLARALAQLGERGCLLLDEPMSAMDLRHAAECAAVLGALARQGATVVIAMHDVSLAAAIADDAWLLHRGRLAAAGPVEQVLGLEQLRGLFGVEFEWVQTRDGRRLLPRVGTAARP